MGLTSPHWRGGAGVSAGPEKKKKKKKKQMHEQCFDLNLLCLLVSELTGRESLDRDMLQLLKAIFSFYSTLCKSRRLFGLKRLHWVTSDLLDVKPLNATLHQPASGRAASLNTSRTWNVSVICHICLVYCHRGNIVLPFQIIANHCHSST